MAQSMVYADLRFAKVPTGRSTACQALEAALGMDEAESPYENMQQGQAPTGQDEQGPQPSPGPWCRLRSIPVGLLAACCWPLLPPWAVAMGLEVAQARAELQRAWLEGNSSQLELQSLDLELDRTMEVLRTVEKELQDVKGKLNASESTVSSLRSCSNIDCCPSGWVMYRNKCLFISAEKKTWEDSRADCDTKISHLLITKSWSRWTVPNFLKNSDTPYWIGLYKSGYPWFEYGYGLEEEDPSEEGGTDAWIWIDGSLYERSWQWKSNGSCAIISHGSIKPAQCNGDNDVHFWICEKAPGPSSPFLMG
ncbi:PREDICTED: B-cell differentiation antigen CD72 [Tinamus guttatus]|uniref:B-cell differentiation antigen CD72 n=1 Tax=Tinamus guttatus TaxID=94827 RepID=UPI00052E863E|nr:PREDICTED: B-cell differentiation antigen CD72 [Tinamus guttatus]